jgi:hypothetical protein
MAFFRLITGQKGFNTRVCYVVTARDGVPPEQI